jgi:cold shock CspA family protein
MALTTSITDAETARAIRACYLSTSPFQVKLQNVRKFFCDFLVAEDAQHASVLANQPEYECQHNLLEQLRRFSSPEFVGVSQGANSLREEFNEGVFLVEVEGAVDWFDSDKGYGFVYVDGLEGGVYLHAEKIADEGIEEVYDGDVIQCDVARGSKGIYISKVHGVRTDSAPLETVDCRVVRLFAERSYGFARIDGGVRDAFFHYSVFSEPEREMLKLRTHFQAVVAPDRKGRGLQIKRVVSTYP